MFLTSLDLGPCPSHLFVAEKCKWEMFRDVWAVKQIDYLCAFLNQRKFTKNLQAVQLPRHAWSVTFQTFCVWKISHRSTDCLGSVMFQSKSAHAKLSSTLLSSFTLMAMINNCIESPPSVLLSFMSTLEWSQMKTFASHNFELVFAAFFQPWTE